MIGLLATMAIAQHASESLALAHETGRLDFIAVPLAAITILLALGGIFAFFDVRRSAGRISKQVAEEEARTVAEATAVAYLERELPKLMSEYQELARNAVGGVEANAIAQAQGDPGSFSVTSPGASGRADRHDPV
jgi:hypothetical protein